MKITLENGQTIEISDKSYKELAKHANGRWRAEKEEEYWYVDSTGAELVSRDRPENIVTNYRYDIGNYFSNIEEAQHYKEVLLATQKIKDFANFELDWSDEGQIKYYISYAYTRGRFEVGIVFTEQGIGQIYFATEKRAEQCIKELEPELKLVLGVE